MVIASQDDLKKSCAKLSEVSEKKIKKEILIIYFLLSRISSRT